MKPYLFFLRQAEHRSSAFLSKKADLDRSGNHLIPKNLENLWLLFPSNRSTANLISLTKSETSSPVLIFQTIRIEIIEATSFASSRPAKMRTPSFSSEPVPVSLQIEEHQQCTNRRAPFIHHCIKGKNTFCNTKICRKNMKPSRKKRWEQFTPRSRKQRSRKKKKNTASCSLARDVALSLKRSYVPTSYTLHDCVSLTGPCLKRTSTCSPRVLFPLSHLWGQIRTRWISCLSNHVPSSCSVALEHVPHEMCSHCVILGEQIRSYMNLMSLHHASQSMSRSIKTCSWRVLFPLCHFEDTRSETRWTSCPSLMSPVHVTEHQNMFPTNQIPHSVILGERIRN
jgi:hypothetical protein